MDFGSEFFELDYAAFYKGAFFSYVVSFPEEKYDFVKQTLIVALGKPGAASSALVGNLYGATFDKETVVWASANVAVVLNQRAGKIDTGNMAVVYLPISEKAPKQPTAGAAPF